MAKYKVKYEILDGVEPVSKYFIKLMSPMSFSIPPNSEKSIKLGIKFDCPLIILETLAQQFVDLKSYGKVAAENTEVSIVLCNSSLTDTAFFERGDQICMCTPAINSFVMENKNK